MFIIALLVLVLCAVVVVGACILFAIQEDNEKKYRRQRAKIKCFFCKK